MVVDCPDCVPSEPESVKLSWYFAVVAELVANRSNKLFEAKAELQNRRGEVHAKATGKYLPIKGEALAVLIKDFAESADGLFE